MPHFDGRLERICALLEDKYWDEVHPVYVAQKENFEQERRYQPRIVVDDDEDGNSEEEELN